MQEVAWRIRIRINVCGIRERSRTAREEVSLRYLRGLPDLANKQAGAQLNLNFRKTAKKIFSSSLFMQYLGYTDSKKIICCLPKNSNLPGHTVFILSGNPKASATRQGALELREPFQPVLSWARVLGC